MSEKNTHSILETIKKKLQKFDQKSEKISKIDDVSSEFSYIAPERKSNESKTEPKIEENNFSDSKESLSAANKILSPQSQPASGETGLEKFNPGDIDFDDESGDQNKKPASKYDSKNQPASQTAEDFNDADIEDYEDEVDFGEDSDTDISDENDEKDDEDSKSDDSDLTDEEQDEDDPLLSDAEDNLSAEADSDSDAEVEQEDDASDSDELEFDEESIEEEQKQSESPVLEQKDAHDIELEALEKELDEHEKKIAQTPQIPSETKKEINPHDEIDLEFERELMGLKPQASNETILKQNLNNEQIKEQKINKAQITVATNEQMDLEPVDDILLDEGIVNQKSYQATVQQQQSLQINDSQAVKIKDRGSLIHDATIVQTTESVKRLIDAKNIVSGITALSQSPTLQELAIQLMEPKLERWLNDNLPQVVEKIVREEIKKIIPKE